MKHDDSWEPRARQIAEEPVESARDGATASQMALAAKLALSPLGAEYEHAERIKQAMRCVYLSDGSSEDNQDAKDTVRDALAGLAVGCSDREIEKTKQAPLEPIRQLIAARKQEERAAEERKEAKRRLMNLARHEVGEHAQVMLQAFEYQDGESGLRIELRTGFEVEKVLHAELDGTETDARVRSRVRELMEEAEGCK